MSGIQVASLFGVLEMRDQATQVMRGVDSGLERLGSRMQDIGGRISSFGVGITAAMTPFVAAIGAGISAAGNFDGTLAEVGARAGLTSEQLARVSEFALQMGADTMFSGQQALDAFLQLLTGGSSLEEAFAQLPHVLNAAAAGGMELGRTADMITDIMAGFRLEVSATEGMVNQIAMAAGSSSTTMAQLMDALASVGPVASQFGLGMTEAVGTLATMANFGIKGAEAGTALRSMLLNLNRPTEGVRNALQRLGVSLYDAQGNTRNMRNVLRELSVALSGLPAEEANQLAVELAGSYGIVAFNALMASGGIDAALEAMGGAADAATVAAARMDTFDGRINSLKGSVETLAIVALTPFMNNVLKPLADELTILVNRVTDWAKANPELVTTILSVVSAVAVFGTSLTAAGIALKLIVPVISAILSPLGLLAAAVGAVALAFSTDFMGIRTAAEQALTPVIDSLKRFFSAIRAGASLEGILQTIMPRDAALALADAFENIKRAAEEFLSAAGRAVGEFIGVFTGVGESVMPNLDDLANWFLQEALPGIINFIADVVIPRFTDFMNMAADLWRFAAPYLQQFFEWFTQTGLPEVRRFIENAVIPTVQRLIEVAKDIWEEAGPAVQQFVTVIGGALDWFRINVIEPAIARVQELINAFRQLSEGLGAYNSVGSNVNIITQGLSTGQFSLGQVLSAAGNAIASEFGIGGTRAMGGPVQGGKAYLVGERGPELFVPGSSGMVLPNSGGVHIGAIYVNADGVRAEQVEGMIRRAFLEVLR